MPEVIKLEIEEDAAIDTWFGIGGRADRLARPENIDELRQCLRIDPDLRIMGDGANLLVADGGVRELVVSLERFNDVEIAEDGLVRAQAGVDLPRLVLDSVRAGLDGLHTLAGVPATVGGAVAMNAGGKYGNTFDHLAEVTTLDREGELRTEPASNFNAGYRNGGLDGRIVVEAVFQLIPGDATDIRERFKAIMAEKKHSQPMGERCAGCVFKNPVLTQAMDGIGEAGDRVGAGLLIDRAGCKGLAAGGASVSERHANFMVVDKDRATATDVIELIGRVQHAVSGRFGVDLETEVVIWGQP
ncbi:MAG: UDP-N-acetylmuramate dehydrogenase [Phycisphaera sp.]|nr:MAG: UDP-N-acetylmuramate dehydrogenase [Phycisphaera sp.]